MGLITHKILVLSGKGGVGKSTVAANLAVSLSLSGKSVGLLDIDIHGPSIPKLFNLEDEKLTVIGDSLMPVKVSENLKVMSIGFMLMHKDDPVIWRGPRKYHMIRQFVMDVEWGELDYLIIDSPPGTGDEPLSVVQLLKKVDGSLIVSTPQDVALLDARKTIKFSSKMGVPVIGLIENMSAFVCPHCGKAIDIFKGSGVKKAAKDFNVDILGNIPIDTEIVSAGDEGRSVFADDKNPVAKKVFEEIVEKIIKKVEK